MGQDRAETLTKKDIARRVADLQDEPIYVSEDWVSSVLDAMAQLMMEADPEVRIELRDFGVFEGTIVLYVNDLSHLQRLMERIKRIEGIHGVYRFEES